MGSVWAWTRHDLRRRWRSLVVLALLIGLSGAVVMSALAGARRVETALPRLVAATDATDAAILANTPGFDWEAIAELPYVQSLSRFILSANSGVILDVPEEVQFNLDFAHPPGDPLYADFERPVVLEGRMYDPSAADEAVVTGDFLNTTDKEIGDTIEVRLLSREQVDAGDVPDDAEPADLKGPTLELTIVGLVRSPWTHAEAGGLAFPPGVVAAYPESFYGSEFEDPEHSESVTFNAMVELEHGEADIPRLRRDIERLTGRTDVEIWDMAQAYRDQNDNPEFDARSLTAFAFAALVAALFLVGQAIARFASSTATELGTARALGMAPRQVVAAATSAPLLAGLGGAVLAATAAVVASQLFPFGIARYHEPDPGIAMDTTVIVVGSVVLVVLTGLTAAVSALVLSSSRVGARRRRTSALAALTARVGLPLPAQVGTRFALERGYGRSAVPVRPALVGAVAGVIGVVAVSIFSSGVIDASEHPERFGKTYQLGGFFGAAGQDFVDTATVYSTLVGRDEVHGLTDAKTDVAILSGGSASVQLWQHSEDKPLATVVVDGRMPESQDEVLLTPGSIEALGTEVGDTVEFGTAHGRQTVTVVGAGFVPTGPHNDYDDGGWLTPEGYDRLFDGFKYHLMFVAVDPGIPVERALENLNAALLDADPSLAGQMPVLFDIDEVGFGVSDITDQLKSIRTLPIALACFLGLLAIGTVGHALSTAVRRRAHDLAVFRALGMTRWQSRWIVITQACVLALVGLSFGIPLGIAAGRTVWRAVADYTPFDYVPPTGVLALLLVGPGAFLVVNLIAVWPSQRAAKTPVATVLRAE